ncbi:hypothetical protein [Spirosoma fluminis]
MKQLTAFSLLLITFCSCEPESIMRQEPTTTTNPSAANARQSVLGGTIINGPSLPAPTIIEQTYIPANEWFADTRCRAWRITWPTYPAGTSPKLIPTMFSIATGTPYSFNFLNNTAAANTYKTTFNLYHANKLASVYNMWEELSHVVGNTDKLEPVRFNKSKFSAATIETWVKGRPNLFEIYWEDTVDTATDIENYQKGDIYLFKLTKQNRYGGIRVVSITPRIIEVYFAEPNS